MTSGTSRTALPRICLGAVVAAALAVSLVGPATAAPAAQGRGSGSAGSVHERTSTAAPRLSVSAVLTARLRGAQEVPGPADPDGRGETAMVLLRGADQVCYVLHVSHIDDVVAGHIHRGAPGVAGPIVVSLQLPPGARRLFVDCVDADPAVLRDIASSPQDFYVNVHTTAFPAGAIRGQLQPLHLH
jgi:hypothetical protein